MLSFKKWLEAVAPHQFSYDDLRNSRSSSEQIQSLKDLLKPYVDSLHYEIAGHGLRSSQDANRIFRLGMQAPNQGFLRLVRTVFEAGIPLENQPDEAFDHLLQWSFGGRKDILLIKLPPQAPESVWRPIRDDEEKSLIPTALTGVKWSIDPKWIIGYLDVRLPFKFFPNKES